MADNIGERRNSGVSMLAYWLVTIGIYFMVAVPFYLGSYEKLKAGYGAPAGIAKSFAGTFIEKFPGVDLTWFVLAIMEGLVVVGLLISVIRGEFLPSRTKQWMLASLAWAMVVFSFLSFGQNLTGNNAGVATQWAYFTGAGVLFLIARRLPKRLPGDWWNRGTEP